MTSSSHEQTPASPSSNNPSPPHAAPAGIPFIPPRPPAPSPPSSTEKSALENEISKKSAIEKQASEKSDIEKEVAQALGGVSIEDLMGQSAASAPATAPRLDPSRPVRGGRPSARRHDRHDRSERTADGVNPDNIKKGKIVAIQGTSVLVEIGGKSQGICPLEQFDQVSPTTDSGEKKGVEIGQEYEFIFKGYDPREGLIMLARRGAIQHGAWETLQPGDNIEATVTGVNKGGLELKVGTTRAFMPAGQVDTKFNQDLSLFLNQKMTVRVMKVDRRDHNILLSRRAVLEEEEAKKAEEAWDQLAVGQICEGTVRSVQSYGAFVDVGGVDGLLHVSAMSHQRVTDPKSIVKDGDKIQVMITGIDKEKKRISLSLKSMSKDPWDTVPNDFPVGTTVEGTVKRVVDFGAFVELAPGIEGLVHVSQIALKRINRPSEIVKETDKIKAKVLSIDLEKRRISLSMAEVERDAKIASGELKPEEPKPAAAGAAAAPAKTPAKPKKQLKGGLF